MHRELFSFGWLIAIMLLLISGLACSFQPQKEIVVVTATPEPQQVAQVTLVATDTSTPLPTATLAPTQEPAVPTAPATSARPVQPTAAPPGPTAVPTVPPPIPVPTEIIRESSRGTGQGVTVKFIYPDYSPAATNSLVFRVIAFQSKGPKTDGAGIQEVEFRICRKNCDSDQNVVYHRIEKNAAYCAFGGGEPTCNVFTFSKGTYWPGTNTPVQDGDYVIDAHVRAKNGDWQGQVAFKIRLP